MDRKLGRNGLVDGFVEGDLQDMALEGGPAAEGVAIEVRRDLEQPGFHPGLAAEGVEVLEDTQENVLREVLAFVVRKPAPDEEEEDLPVVIREDLPEVFFRPHTTPGRAARASATAWLGTQGHVPPKGVGGARQTTDLQVMQEGFQQATYQAGGLSGPRESLDRNVNDLDTRSASQLGVAARSYTSRE